MTRKKIVPEYSLAEGKTIKEIHDWGDSVHSRLVFEFTDGTCLDICGHADGYDIEYEGLFYEFFPYFSEALREHRL